jgi:hypothetical protein
MKVMLIAVLLLASGCSQAGNLGEILGGVLNAPTAGVNQANGTIQSVDTRSQVVYITTNGQNVGFRYDNNTQVSYQNQNYPVTALERGDQVSVQFEQTSQNVYYVSIIQVNQSVSSTTSSGTYNDGRIYVLQGNVRTIDRTNGVFTMNTQDGQTVTITMPYNPRSNDVTRFNQLRNGDYVRLQGELLNNTRFELRQFE